MAYIDGMLASGERPVRREHQHWFVLVADARYGILAVLGAILLLILERHAPDRARSADTFSAG